MKTALLVLGFLVAGLFTGVRCLRIIKSKSDEIKHDDREFLVAMAASLWPLVWVGAIIYKGYAGIYKAVRWLDERAGKRRG